MFLRRPTNAYCVMRQAAMIWLLAICPYQQLSSGHEEATASTKAKGEWRIVLQLDDNCPPELPDRALEQQCVAMIAEAHGPSEHALSTKGCLAFPAMRKDCQDLPYKAAYLAALRRVVPILMERGWTDIRVINAQQTRRRHGGALDALARADVVIGSTQEYRSLREAVRNDTGLIMVTTHDAATLNGFGPDLGSPRILAILQHTSFSDLRENNHKTYAKRRHAAWIRKSGIRVSLQVDARYELKPQRLSGEALAKVRTLVPQVFRWRFPLDCGGASGHGQFVDFANDGFRKADDHSFAAPLSERPIDIAFAGEVEGSSGFRRDMGVVGHRQAAIAAVRRVARRHGLRVYATDSDIPYRDYVKLVRSSKMFVSPFGLGEFSGKDYEVPLGGGVLIKPLAERIVGYPNIYDPKYTLSTLADFSDLGAVVLPYLQSPGGLERAQEMADAARAMLRANSSELRLGSDMDRLLTRLLIAPRSFDGHPSSSSL